MNPMHHVPDEMLLAYAAGSTSEGESLFVAVHASLCRACRARVGELEALGGAMLERVERASVSDDLLSRTLGLLDQNPRAERKASVARDPIFPRPLVELIGPSDQLPWKKALAGVHVYDLPLMHGDMPVRLRRFAGGTHIVPHGHHGAELDLVLSGGVSDDRNGVKFERGDVAYNDQADAHSLTIEPGEDCVALSVHDARVKPIGLWSRLVYGYLRW